MKTTVVLLFSVVALFAGCRSTYYNTMEKFGFEKRDILVDRVETARDAQEDTREQFASILEEFSALVDFDGGDLERLYKRLSRQFERAEASAATVGSTIDKIEQVGSDLFKEWEAELDEYTSDSLRQKSAEQLRSTKDQYEALVVTMRRAENKIPPVLAAFRDQVLFLKHNLNAQAVASLENEALRIEDNVKSLIEEMNTAINEANAFITAMK